MGLIYASARLLLAARRDGFEFANVATLGRQQVYIRPHEVKLLVNEFGDDAKELCGYIAEQGEFCEPFLQRLLQCETVTSIDFSDFEGATIQHDMNLPVTESMEQRFDAVIDGGTLEHIFNFPMALSNCMRMTRVGGCVAISTIANNHCGHGFYQFSPELFFRVFQPQNGFEICNVILVEHPFPGAELSSVQRFHEVTDPDALKCRVHLVSRFPTLLMVLAKRVSDCDIFAETPQQSDYQSHWSSHQAQMEQDVPQAAESPGSLSGLRREIGKAKRAVYGLLPENVERWLVGRRQRRDFSLKNRKFYRPWEP